MILFENIQTVGSPITVVEGSGRESPLAWPHREQKRPLAKRAAPHLPQKGAGGAGRARWDGGVRVKPK